MIVDVIRRWIASVRRTVSGQCFQICVPKVRSNQSVFQYPVVVSEGRYYSHSLCLKAGSLLRALPGLYTSQVNSGWHCRKYEHVRK